MQKPRTTNLRVEVIGIVLGAIAFLAAVKIFAEGRYATDRVWVMLGLFWVTWGLADMLPSRLHVAVRILRIATFLCALIGVWFTLQL